MLLGCSERSPSPAPSGIRPRGDVDAAALARLRERAKATHSDVLIVAQHGEILVEEGSSAPGEPIPMMSITKSITALAIGCLVQDGALRSVDVPAHTYVPRWSIGPRAGITVRHILEHTSGLEADVDTRAIYESTDTVQFASLAKLVSPPGERFFYNNRAVAVLAPVVEAASGQRLDEFVFRRLYEPLGIASRSWSCDRERNPRVMAGAVLTGRELLAVGQLVLDGGRVGTRQLLDPTWLAEATGRGSKANPLHGQLWWLIPEWTHHVIDAATLDAWHKAGVDSGLIAKFEPLADRESAPESFAAAVAGVFGGDDTAVARWAADMQERRLPTHAVRYGPILGCRASGYLGQHLVVLPRRGLVALRLIRPDHHSDPDHNFDAFVAMVMRL